MLLNSSMAGRRLHGGLCLGSTYSAGLTEAGTPSDHTSVVPTCTTDCTATAQLFWIASVLNPPICWMKQIQGEKQKRKSPLVCQILVCAKGLHTSTGPKYLSERLEAQVGY